MKKANLNRVAMLVCTVFVLQGCATLGTKDFGLVEERNLSSAEFFQTLDREVRKNHAQNEAPIRIANFPYLRTNRFLIGMQDKISTPEQEDLWVDRMHELALTTRTTEIKNLSQDSINRLAQQWDTLPSAEGIIARMEENSYGLLKKERSREEFIAALRDSMRDPGEYSTITRVLGLYPLFSLPIQIGAKSAYDKFRDWHTQSLSDLPKLGTLNAYYPAPSQRVQSQRWQARLDGAARDSFGLPVLTEADVRMVAEQLAPVLYQDVAADYDKIGEVFWLDDTVSINTDKPTVYYYLTESFIDNKPVLQINYAFWYLSRSGPKTPWFEKGPLDGLTVRITLNTDAEPVMMDIMNTCGCYHFFAPHEKSIARVKVLDEGIDPLILGRLPDGYPRTEMGIYMKSGWHQVQSIFAGRKEARQNTYVLKPYSVLESLPKEDGRFESVFNKKGIMKDSWRIEPILFFPSGIAKIGFMRQQGNHPTKLIGRQYFTDPQIFDQRFEFN